MPRQDKSASRAVDRMIGRRIKFRRLLLDLPQAEVAKQLGISFQQLQKYENGDNSLSAGHLYRLSLALKVPADYVFGELREAADPEHAPSQPDPTMPDEVSRQSVTISSDFTRIKNPKTRRIVVDLVKQIADFEEE